MQTAKDGAASAKAGMEKTKATVQEKVPYTFFILILPLFRFIYQLQ